MHAPQFQEHWGRLGNQMGLTLKERTLNFVSQRPCTAGVDKPGVQALEDSKPKVGNLQGGAMLYTEGRFMSFTHRSLLKLLNSQYLFV